jgi:predicted kinase
VRRAARAHGEEVDRPELAVLVGLQGAGKTTFYRARLAATHEHVSRDRFRGNPDPSRRQRQLLAEALHAGRSVALDNTSPTRAERAAALEVAREAAARAVCYYFVPDLQASLARNAGRRGKERVPVVGILATRRRLEPPTLAEGFDRLLEVRALPGGAFEVREVEGGRGAAAVDEC